MDWQQALLIPVFIWLVILTYYLYKISAHYQRLTQATGEDNLTKVLDKILDELYLNKTKTEEVAGKLRELVAQNVYHIQKIGILRFNPFENTGGNQSFVLAILDGKDCGVVLTSLHSRSGTRWYAKNVRNAKGVDHQLSAEEEEAIKSAKALGE